MGRDPVTPNHAQQQPQSSQALYQCGFISLFDGCASTHDLITEAAEVPPTVFRAAENDLDIRRYVATRNKWNLDGEWFCKGASHYRYLEDVNQLADNGGGYQASISTDVRHPLHRHRRITLPGPYHHQKAQRRTRIGWNAQHLLLHIPSDVTLPTRGPDTQQSPLRARERGLNEGRIPTDHPARTWKQRTHTTATRTRFWQSHSRTEKALLLHQLYPHSSRAHTRPHPMGVAMDSDRTTDPQCQTQTPAHCPAPRA